MLINSRANKRQLASLNEDWPLDCGHKKVDKSGLAIKFTLQMQCFNFFYEADKKKAIS